jgi:hypothetical protein
MNDEPDLELNGFALWVHTRDFPEDDWLTITARMRASGALVEMEGPILRIVELQGFAEELRRMVDALSGSATLEGLEPGLRLSLQMQKLGGVSAEVFITPDQLTQSHTFTFGVDQTHLPPLLRGCESILDRFS